MDEKAILGKIGDEAARIMEDSIYSAKGHFGAASRWGTLHFWIGLISTLFAAAAGTSAFSKTENGPTIAGILAFVVAVLTASITFIKPSDKASLHKSAGNKYLSLRNDTRIFMDILLPQSASEAATKAITELNQRRNTLNEQSPIIPSWAFKKAREGIEEGQTTYAIDSAKG